MKMRLYLEGPPNCRLVETAFFKDEEESPEPRSAPSWRDGLQALSVFLLESKAWAKRNEQDTSPNPLRFEGRGKTLAASLYYYLCTLAGKSIFRNESDIVFDIAGHPNKSKKGVTISLRSTGRPDAVLLPSNIELVVRSGEREQTVENAEKIDELATDIRDQWNKRHPEAARSAPVIREFGRDVIEGFLKNLPDFFPEGYTSSGTTAVFEPRRDDDTAAFLFPEVTGLAIFDALLLEDLTGTPDHFKRAIKCADWICSSAQDACGGVLARKYVGDGDEPWKDKICSFDTAICLSAVVRLCRTLKRRDTEEKRRRDYLDSATKMGEFLLGGCRRNDWTLPAVYSLEKEQWLPDEPNFWSKRPGVWQSKVAEALVDLADAMEALSDPQQHGKPPHTPGKYREAAEKLCATICRKWANPKDLTTSKRQIPGQTQVQDIVELHPLLYGASGLLRVGQKARKPKFVEAAQKITAWVLARCKEGQIDQLLSPSETAPIAPEAKFRTDSLAQALELALELAVDIGHARGLEEDDQKIHDLATKIMSMKEHGGIFQYGFYDKKVNGQYEAKTRCSWLQGFTVAALWKYYIWSLLDDTDVIILAGGEGSRSWPLSCAVSPKPLVKALLDDRSLLQDTIRRYKEDQLIRPERIFVLSSKCGLEETRKQAKDEYEVADGNVFADPTDEPQGTVAALSYALDKVRERAKERPDEKQNRLVIVSMADNVFEPTEAFQAALRLALVTARERDCIVAIGKQIDGQSTRDSRFGHISYLRGDRLKPYGTYRVAGYHAEPDEDRIAELTGVEGNLLAWECGTLVFPLQLYAKLTEEITTGNLPKEVLSKAGDWSQAASDKLRMAVSLLPPGTRFEDFGVLGKNVLEWFPRDSRDGNVCLGNKKKVSFLCCRGNLVIAEQAQVRLYGLREHLVIDRETTNAAVQLPLAAAGRLSNLYEALKDEKALGNELKPYTVGGKAAEDARPLNLALRADGGGELPHDTGLAVNAYTEVGLLRRRRKRGGIEVDARNKHYPEIDDIDHDILSEKEKEDPKLVKHLIDVTAVAESLVGGNLVLTDKARQILKLTCLYHDFGGYLRDDLVRDEGRVIDRFEKIFKGDRRQIDSRVMTAILASVENSDRSPNDMLRYLNDSVNSAVEFISTRVRREPMTSEERDVVVSLIHDQDRPDSFQRVKRILKEKSAALFDAQRQDRMTADDLDGVFALLKIGDIVTNGRWFWKRNLCRTRDPRQTQLERDRGALEEFVAIVARVIHSLKQARIAPDTFVARLNECFLDKKSEFRDNVQRLERDGTENAPSLVCDELYRFLLECDGQIGSGSEADKSLGQCLEQCIGRVQGAPNEAYQVQHLKDFAKHLARIVPHCEKITNSTVERVGAHVRMALSNAEI